jgi:dUTP pyrophosphatase
MTEEHTEIGFYLDRETYPIITTPFKAHSTDAGFDIKSVESLLIPKGNRSMVHTGVYLSIPEGWECQVRPRSGLALKEGITVLNSPGTIDSQYVGEVCVILQNCSRKDFFVNIGDRIAQLVFKRVPLVYLNELSEKPTNGSRGDKGFGSTGL